MTDSKRDSQSNRTRARPTDYCLIGALLLLLAISWKDSATGSLDLHQAARQVVAQHVGESSRQDRSQRVLARQAEESCHCFGLPDSGYLCTDCLIERRGIGTGKTGPERRNNDHNTHQLLSFGRPLAAAVDMQRRMTPVHGPD